MSQSVWKFTLSADDGLQVSMPAGSEALSVAVQNKELVLWAKVDSERPTVTRYVQVRGTGYPLDGTEGKFIGTVLMMGGALVWHVFVSPE